MNSQHCRTRCRVLVTTWVACLGVFWTEFASAEIFEFGSGENQFSMEFTEVGSPGNPLNSVGIGRREVGYTFQMGVYQVSRDMVEKANNEAGLGIALADMSGHGGNGYNRPATGVSWGDAARFVNWLNTSHGHQAAYRFDNDGNLQAWDGADVWQLDGTNVLRHKDAQFWLPNIHEWYKAAYYDPSTAEYFTYPTSGNFAPTAVASGTEPNTAVYGQGIDQGPGDITLAGGLSPFGTMGQGGNVWEWQEDLSADLDSFHWIRGGSWTSAASALSGESGDPLSFLLYISETNAIGFEASGFRVASAAPVPEPSAIAMWWTAVALFWLWRPRK